MGIDPVGGPRRTLRPRRSRTGARTAARASRWRSPAPGTRYEVSGPSRRLEGLDGRRRGRDGAPAPAPRTRGPAARRRDRSAARRRPGPPARRRALRAVPGRWRSRRARSRPAARPRRRPRCAMAWRISSVARRVRLPGRRGRDTEARRTGVRSRRGAYGDHRFRRDDAVASTGARPGTTELVGHVVGAWSTRGREHESARPLVVTACLVVIAAAGLAAGLAPTLWSSAADRACTDVGISAAVLHPGQHNVRPSVAHRRDRFGRRRVLGGDDDSTRNAPVPRQTTESPGASVRATCAHAPIARSDRRSDPRSDPRPRAGPDVEDAPASDGPGALRGPQGRPACLEEARRPVRWAAGSLGQRQTWRDQG